MHGQTSRWKLPTNTGLATNYRSTKPYILLSQLLAIDKQPVLAVSFAGCIFAKAILRMVIFFVIRSLCCELLSCQSRSELHNLEMLIFQCIPPVTVVRWPVLENAENFGEFSTFLWEKIAQVTCFLLPTLFRSELYYLRERNVSDRIEDTYIVFQTCFPSFFSFSWTSSSFNV